MISCYSVSPGLTKDRSTGQYQTKDCTLSVLDESNASTIGIISACQVFFFRVALIETLLTMPRVEISNGRV